MRKNISMKRAQSRGHSGSGYQNGGDTYLTQATITYEPSN
jgi:hypothetical protein